jgi:hypothetical protein
MKLKNNLILKKNPQKNNNKRMMAKIDVKK